MRDRPVLPKLPPSKLKSLDDLLTDEQKASLYADLDKMARQRRQAEAESAHVALGVPLYRKAEK